MALGFARTLIHPVSGQTINAGATYTSPEQDLGADTLAEQIWLYVQVTGFAANPGGNELFHIYIIPIHTTSGDGFDDNIIELLATADADQKYQWAWKLDSLPRYFKVAIKNDTGQNTDASAVDGWIEVVKVTA